MLVAACILLAIPALLIGIVGGPPDKPYLIAGAILLGSATIAAALPDDARGGGPPRGD